MWEKELETAELVKDLVYKAINSLMKQDRIRPNDLPKYAEAVKKCESDVNYYIDLVEKEKEKCKNSSVLGI